MMQTTGDNADDNDADNNAADDDADDNADINADNNATMQTTDEDTDNNAWEVETIGGTSKAKTGRGGGCWGHQGGHWGC